MQNDAKRFRNPYGRDAAPLRSDEVVKVRVVPAALLPLVATRASRDSREGKGLGELDNGTCGCSI